MKEYKLISMVEFVKKQDNYKRELGQPIEAFHLLKLLKVRRYAEFLSQPLKLGMFVPCDEDGNVLRKPSSGDMQYQVKTGFKDLEQYQQAKERVLFEGLYNSHHTNEFNTQLTIKHKNGFRQIILEEYDIEGLITLGFSITLTQNAIKTIYG